MREYVVFYAWQSDRPAEITRSVIRDALETAAKTITGDTSARTRVLIDSDTQGALGHVPVIDTIIEKLTAADAFVPDLTFVAVTEDGKHIPNPNVLLEYGYALSAKSHSIMIPVMNAAYGEPEKLPFDMGHRRHPLTFNLNPASTPSERLKAAKTLSRDFEEILRLMIAAAPSKPKTEKPFAEAKAATPPAFFFKPSEVLATFGMNESERQLHRFESNRAIFLRLFPASAEDQPTVGRAKLKEVFTARKPCAMSLNVGGLANDNAYGSIILDPIARSGIAGMTQGFPTGELWGLNSQPFRSEKRPVFKGDPETVDYVGMISVEKLFVRSLENYIRIAVGEYQLRPPFIVEAGGTGLLGAFAVVPGLEVQNEYVGPFRSPSFERRYVLENEQPHQISDVLRKFFDEFYDFAACSRSKVLTDAHVAANRLPPRTPI